MQTEGSDSRCFLGTNVPEKFLSIAAEQRHSSPKTAGSSKDLLRWTAPDSSEETKKIFESGFFGIGPVACETPNAVVISGLRSPRAVRITCQASGVRFSR